jgi:large subunit ribosomal protein L9
MKVILRDDVEKLGKLGEVVDVRDGYARNYLLPRQLAYLCTADSEKQINAERKRRLMKEQKQAEELKAAADLLNGRSITISQKAQEEKLYGSVGAEEIAKGLTEEHKVHVPASAIVLEAPFKTLGTFDVVVRMAPGAEATIKVWIVSESGDAETRRNRKTFVRFSPSHCRRVSASSFRRIAGVKMCRSTSDNHGQKWLSSKSRL